MNEALKMQISAFVDGELPQNEAELLLRRLNQDLAMRQQVAEYLAIGRLLRQDPEVAGMDALRNRIASALGEDSLPAALSLVPEKNRLLKPVLGFALAASVAVLAVVGLRQSVMPGADESKRVAIAESTPFITQAAVEDAVSEELRYMYRRHSASSADFGANDIMTRLVTLELQGGELVRVEPEHRSLQRTSTNLAERAVEAMDDSGADVTSQPD
jgi:negative regulator of sigma E activity